VPRPETELRKQPTQARSRALVDALVEATELILSERGVEAVTTAQVAERAGVSIGSLYQYFPGREALIAAVIERRLESDVRELTPTVEALRGASLDEVIGGLVEIIIRYYRAETPLYREMIAAMAAVDREQHVRQVVEGIDRIFHVLLEPHRARLDPDLDANLFAARTAVLACVREAALHRPQLLQGERFELRLRALVRGVLGVREGG
jgi:AcrR family transcriptional regulator